MLLVKIDIVDSHSLQTAFDCPLNVMPVNRSKTLSNWWDEPASSGSGNLGCNDQRIPIFRFDPFAKNLFSQANSLSGWRYWIDFSSIIKIDAPLEGSIQYLE